MKVILISGWKGSGKDSVADYLMNNHNFIKFTFAKTLKNYTSKLYNIPLRKFYNRNLKEKPLLKFPVKSNDKFTDSIHKLLLKEFSNDLENQDLKYWTPRALIILEGSIKRSVDSNFWVKKVMKEMEGDGLYYKPELCVISDCRYKSEVKAFKEKFGKDLITIRINRFNTINTNDPSERDLDNYNFDYVLNNNGSLEDLYKKIDEIFRS